MNYLSLARFRPLSVSLLLMFPFAVYATEVQVPWNSVCKVSDGRQLTATTLGGNTVDGYCVSITVDELTIRTDEHRMIKISRAALSRLQMHRSQAHQMRSLGKGVRQGLLTGSRLLLTPYAPVGLILLPATVAWSVVAAPFCGLGDLVSKMAGKQGIRII
jgi:hypothetical protein